MFFIVNFKIGYRRRMRSFGIPDKTSNLGTVVACGLLVFQSKLKLPGLNSYTVRTTILRIQSSHHNFSNKKKTQYVKTFIFFIFFFIKRTKG